MAYTRSRRQVLRARVEVIAGFMLIIAGAFQVLQSIAAIAISSRPYSPSWTLIVIAVDILAIWALASLTRGSATQPACGSQTADFTKSAGQALPAVHGHTKPASIGALPRPRRPPLNNHSRPEMGFAVATQTARTIYTVDGADQAAEHIKQFDAEELIKLYEATIVNWRTGTSKPKASESDQTR